MAVTVTVTSPAASETGFGTYVAGANINVSFTYTVAGSDPHGGFSNVRLKIDGDTAWSSVTGGGDGSHSTGSTALAPKTTFSGQVVVRWTDGENDYDAESDSVSFTTRGIPAYLSDVCIGSDGSFILAAGIGGQYQGGAWISTDFGASWARKLPDGNDGTNWDKGICSSDGTYCYVESTGDALYRSADSGTSWALITPAGGDDFDVNSFAMSDDGKYVVIVGDNNTDATESCYISSDYGVTWTAKKPVAGSIEYVACDISNDGTVITVSTNEYFYISFDSGATWVAQSIDTEWDNWDRLGLAGSGRFGLAANCHISNGDDIYAGAISQTFAEATWGETGLTSAGRALLDDADAAAQATTLGLGTGDAVTHDTLTLSSIAHEATDVDKFLVDSTGVIKYRTGAEILSDVGLGTGDSPEFTGLTLSGLTQKSILFAGAGGVISEDTNLTWDDADDASGLPTMYLRAETEIRFYGDNNTNWIGLRINPNISATNRWILPTSYGSSGQALTTDGAGTMSWSAPTAGGSDKYIQYNSSGVLAGDSSFYWDYGESPKRLHITGNTYIHPTGGTVGELRFFDGASSDYVGFKGPAATSATSVWSLPAVDGAANEVLGTDGSFGLIWRNHDELSGFVANEHIDHTSVTLTAGAGLTGGGDISANRTFAVDGLLEDLDTLGANSADSEFIVGTGAGALAWESGATARASLGLTIGTHVQAYDAELASLAALSYVAASFVKMTGAATFALRTIGETADDLEATIDHDNLANGGAHDYAYISGNDAGTGITAAELEELSDGSETTLHSHAGIAGHAILDGSTHTDSVADAVTRGSIIYGNATPKWDELVLGAADTFLGSDGTDLSYRTAAQVMASLSAEAAAAFSFNSQNLTAVGAIGCGAVTGTGIATFEGASVTIGKASTTTGTLVLHDSNSANTITLTVPDISAGSLSFTLPPTDGDNTNVLQTNGSGTLTWAAAGSGAFSSRFYAALSASQNVNTGTWTKVLFNTEVFDGDGEYDHVTNYKFTAGSTGYYFVGLTLRFETPVVDKYVQAAINKNNGTYILSSQTHVNTTDHVNTICFGIVYLEAGDYIWGEAFHNFGVSKNVLGAASNPTYFCAHRLS